MRQSDSSRVVWTIDDSRLIGNILDGRGDFKRFVEEIESWVESQGREV